MKSRKHNFAHEIKLAKSLFRHLPKRAIHALEGLLRRHRLSVSNGDLKYIACGWYITHYGLLTPATSKWKQWWAQSPRPALPAYTPASARSQSGQSLRHRLLRHEDAARSHASAGREFRFTPCRLGREGPQCPAVSAEQLFARERKCSMRRYFESLRPSDRSAINSVPDGLFLVRVN